ncbi:MAG: signal peptidase I [Chloroflexi bacterium]|nr:signal peptidase I [Chloroflexota bacterium]
MWDALREVLETLALALVIFLALQFSVQNFRVEGSSMEPALRNREYLVVNKLVYLKVPWGKMVQFLPGLEVPRDRVVYPFHPPQRGDVIVFRFPRDETRDFIKRVVGLPGEVVEIRSGRVYINGVPLSEPYLADPGNDSMRPHRIPEGQYFVMGDNRRASNDSRDWGDLPSYEIIGKAWVVYWPTSSVGLLSTSLQLLR